MISEAKAFWDSISGKVKSLVHSETENALRVQRYDVTTAPDGTTMGVTQPFGSNEIFLPYSKEVAGATVGDTVLVAWWGSMSNARVYYFAKGYDGGAGGGSTAEIASIVFPAAWTDSGNGYWTVTPIIAGVTISAESKIDLQITAEQFKALQADGVENLYVENDNAALTAYAVGSAPSSALTLQCTISGTNAPTPPVNPSLDMIYPVGSIYMSVSSVNPANTIGGTWEQMENNALYMEKEPLWTNLNPTASFTAQTISLDLSGYDFIFIYYRGDASGTEQYVSIIVPVGGRGSALSPYSQFRWRACEVSTTGVTFEAGIFYGSYSGGRSTNNNLLIPQSIYGIRGNGRYVWKRTA